MASDDVSAAVTGEDVHAAVARTGQRGVMAWKGLVLVCFGAPVNHWLYTPEQARDLAAILVAKARLAELQQESETPAAGRNEELGIVD